MLNIYSESLEDIYIDKSKNAVAKAQRAARGNTWGCAALSAMHGIIPRPKTR